MRFGTSLPGGGARVRIVMHSSCKINLDYQRWYQRWYAPPRVGAPPEFDTRTGGGA